jgi:hypothetical protein
MLHNAIFFQSSDGTKKFSAGGPKPASASPAANASIAPDNLFELSIKVLWSSSRLVSNALAIAAGPTNSWNNGHVDLIHLSLLRIAVKASGSKTKVKGLLLQTTSPVDLTFDAKSSCSSLSPPLPSSPSCLVLKERQIYTGWEKRKNTFLKNQVW